MLIHALAYLVGSFAILAILTGMIFRLGTMMSDCPIGGTAARTAALSIATGFASIGAGGVMLIGAALPFLGSVSLAGVLVALGMAALCLGLGFTQAIATLREVLYPHPAPATPAAPDVAATPA